MNNKNKAWIFDREKRDSQLAQWVSKEKARDPSAEKHADFVAACMVDFLEWAEGLYKVLPEPEIGEVSNAVKESAPVKTSPIEESVSVETVIEASQSARSEEGGKTQLRSVEDMKREWYSGDL